MQFSKSMMLFCTLLLSVFLLSSCSSTHKAYLRSLKYAFESPPERKLTIERITNSSSDLAYLKEGQSPTVVLALAYIDNDEYKWVSANHVELIEKNGRLIKTIGLNANIDFVMSAQDDPLAHLPAINDTSTWQRNIDFDQAYFGVSINSTFSTQQHLSLTIQDKIFDTTLVTEQVTLANNAPAIFNETEWINEFWYDTTSGEMLRSKQKAHPNGKYYDMTYVSRAVRL